MNEAVTIADTISKQSAVWCICLLILAIGFSGHKIIVYLNTRCKELNDQLIKTERERSDLILQMSKEREKASADNSAKTEALVRDTLTTHQRIADTLDRFERALERLQDRTT